MKSKTRFELIRWAYFVSIFLLSTACIVVISEYLAGPALQWLFHDAAYSLPSWSRIGRAGLFVLFMGFFAGTLAWFYEKKASGR